MKNKSISPVPTPAQSRSDDRITTEAALAGHSGPSAKIRPEGTAWTSFALAWNNFWFHAVDPFALHVVRIMTGLLLLSWLLPLAWQIEAMFTLNGWIDRDALIALSRLPPELHHRPGWSLLYLCDSVGAAIGLYWATIVVIACFTLGLATRITSILTWLLIASFVNFLSQGIGPCENDLLVMLTFYLMVAYVLLGQFNGKLSLPERILGSWYTFVPFAVSRKLAVSRNDKQEELPSLSFAANFALRLFQVNFALFLVVVCLTKLQSGDWWSGIAFWYPLHNPFETTPDTIRSEAWFGLARIVIYTFGAYVVMAWQLSFPLWAWRPRWRLLLWVGGVLALVGATWIYRNPMLGLFCLIGCLSFVSSEELRRLPGLLARFRLAKLTAKAQTRTLVAAR